MRRKRSANVDMTPDLPLVKAAIEDASK